MTVILYLPDYTPVVSPGGNATMALSEGLTKLGVEHEVRSAKKFRGEVADIAIVNGWTKKMIGGLDEPHPHKQNRNSVIAAQEAAGKPAWCIERGFLLDRQVWSAMSIGGFCSSGGDFRAEGMPPDRWEKLGLELKPWRTGGDYILLCAQVPWDAQVDDGNHLAWLETTAKEIRKHTNRTIVFRGHPKAWRRPDPYMDLSADFWSLVTCWSEPRQYTVEAKDRNEIQCPPTTTFEEDLACAHAVVCYNSNVATLATVAGVPVFTGAPCLADPIAFRDGLAFLDYAHPQHAGLLGQLERNRQQWAYDMAWKQWHVDEFREALPWLHLMR